ncbi:MAG: hypothetical protein N3F06_04110 [Nitrososphaerales archaeon]|nr:hypothetical protein [Nitrososphaerales archaeon]
MSRMIVTGIAVSVVFVLIGGLWLYESAETFDKLAELFGAEEQPIYRPPLPDYEIPGLEGNKVANIIVGVLSTLFVLGTTLIIGKVLGIRRCRR